MKSSVRRHKHFRLNQAKLDRLRTSMGARSETEALEKAMDLILVEEEIKMVLRRIKGKGRLKSIYS